MVTGAYDSYACTSIIISGRYTASGKPLMLKHRDTGELNNRIEYFNGPAYSFIGLVNSPSEGGEVWTGTNSTGFSIMNTASYNIKDDDISYDDMDKEGVLMYKALGICRTVEDFAHFLDTLSRPMLVEANFGVIDAEGGAAYFEVNNYKYVRFDVEDYRIVTNFSTSGRYEDYSGYERYLTATQIFEEIAPKAGKKFDLTPSDIFNSFSRSYRHALLGIDYVKDYNKLSRKTDFTGVAVDQDFIPRSITSASIVIEGVKPGEDPSHTVMWTILGYPACSVAVPLLVADSDRIPSFMKKTGDSSNCLLCDTAMKIKKDNIFVFDISNGSHYLRVDAIVKGRDGKPALLDCCRKAEDEINASFSEIFGKWKSGEMTDARFYEEYDSRAASFIDMYFKHFALFAKND